MFINLPFIYDLIRFLDTWWQRVAMVVQKFYLFWKMWSWLVCFLMFPCSFCLLVSFKFFVCLGWLDCWLFDPLPAKGWAQIVAFVAGQLIELAAGRAILRNRLCSAGMKPIWLLVASSKSNIPLLSKPPKSCFSFPLEKRFGMQFLLLQILRTWFAAKISGQVKGDKKRSVVQ